MKNILKLELYGYTVRGIDLRDGSPFKDHIVASNLNGCNLDDRLNFIGTYYGNLGFKANYVVPDEKPGHNPDKGVAIDLDLHQMYLEQIKMLRDRPTEPITREGGLC